MQNSLVFVPLKNFFHKNANTFSHAYKCTETSYNVQKYGTISGTQWLGSGWDWALN